MPFAKWPVADPIFQADPKSKAEDNSGSRPGRSRLDEIEAEMAGLTARLDQLERAHRLKALGLGFLSPGLSSLPVPSPRKPAGPSRR